MQGIEIFSNLDSMEKPISVSLGKHFEEFIKSELDLGRYDSVSEIVREGLRLLEVRREKEIALRDAIEEGRNSGYIKNFDMVSFLQELEREHEDRN